MNTVIPTQTRTTSVWIYIFLLMAVAAGFSIMLLMPEGLRLDEAQSLWQSSRSPEGILKIVALDVHVPLYHMLLHVWQQFFGNSVQSVRSLSLLFFILTIPATFALGRLAYNQKIALFATLLITLSPFLSWYGNEARMYSLLTLLVVLNQYAFLRISQRIRMQGWVWALFICTTILGTYTHYLFWVFLFAQVLFLILKYKTIGKELMWQFFGVYMLSLVCFAPWILYVIQQGSASNTKPLLLEPTTVNLFNALSQFLFGFQVETVNTVVVSLWPLAVLFVFFALQRNQRMSAQTQYFLLTFMIPIITVFVFSRTVRPFFLGRYLIFVIPSLYLVVSWLFSTYGKAAAWVRMPAIGLILIALITQSANAQTPVREDYKQAVAYLQEVTTARDLIILSAPFTVYPVEYYYRGGARLETLPRWDRLSSAGIPGFDEKQLPADVQAITEFKDKACLVLSYDQGYEETIYQYFEKSYEKVNQKQFSPGLQVACYKLRY